MTEDRSERCYCPHPGCGKGYSNRSNMYRHGKVHGGGGLLSCPRSSCGYATRRNEYLQSHIRNAHTVELAKCPYCDSSFYDLPAHMCNIHSEANHHTVSNPAKNNNTGAIPSSGSFGRFRPIEYAASANVVTSTFPSLSMVDPAGNSLFGPNLRTLPVPHGHPELDRSHVFCQECLLRPVNRGLCHMHQ